MASNYTKAWTKLRNQRIKQAAHNQEPCCRCHRPIDYQLPGNHRDGPTLDHLHPLAHGGELLAEIELLAPAHMRCNSRHGARMGNRMRAGKAAAKAKESARGKAEANPVSLGGIPRTTRAHADRRSLKSRVKLRAQCVTTSLSRPEVPAVGLPRPFPSNTRRSVVRPSSNTRSRPSRPMRIAPASSWPSRQTTPGGRPSPRGAPGYRNRTGRRAARPLGTQCIAGAGRSRARR